MSKYKVGDRVKIVSLNKLKKCSGLNPDGRMDHWADREMTIRYVVGRNSGYYMEEDQAEYDGNTYLGWHWDDNMIEGLVPEINAINSDILLEFLGG